MVEPKTYEMSEKPTNYPVNGFFEMREVPFDDKYYEEQADEMQRDRLLRDFGVSSEKQPEIVDDHFKLRDMIRMAVESQDEIHLDELIEEARQLGAEFKW